LTMEGLGLTRDRVCIHSGTARGFLRCPAGDGIVFWGLRTPRESMVRSVGNKRRRVEADRFPHLGIEMWGSANVGVARSSTVLIHRRINSANGQRMGRVSIYHVSARKETGLTTDLERLSMDLYKKIEKLVADQYGKPLGTRKATGDFMLTDSHAVNVKSNNVDKKNYSANMISIKKMHKWVFEERHDLSFVFVDYKHKGGKLKILKQSRPIRIERLSWDCLSIEAQGYGVIR